MPGPGSTLEDQNHRAPNRWQHRLKRERPTCTERNDSLLESADGSMATVATRRGEMPCPRKTPKNLLDSDRPSHGSDKAIETVARGAVQSAEDARVLAIRKREEEAQEAERREQERRAQEAQ